MPQKEYYWKNPEKYRRETSDYINKVPKEKKCCNNCGKELLKKQQKWCSHICQTRWWSRHNTDRFKFVCENCGKEFYQENRVNAKGEPHRFCSRLCSNLKMGHLKIKEKTRHKMQGYVSVWQPSHPKAYAKRVREHVLVMEQKIGRYLTDSEIVHHINYLEDDNRPENLYLCSNEREHHRVHKKTRFLIKEFIREKGLNKELTDYIIARNSLLK